MLTQLYIDDIINRAIAEDITYIDVTSDLLIPPDKQGKAFFLAKADGVLCGIDIALRAFELLDSSFSFKMKRRDGDKITAGDKLAEFSGSLLNLLKGERTALNLLQHLSGIATQTARCVRTVAGTPARITDTRKTLPGLRGLQKYAVTVGGGSNHRFNLSDGAMIKNNHVDVTEGIPQAVAALRRKLGHMTKIEVEVRNLDELSQALACGADIIMLDNMTPAQMQEAVRLTGGKALLEASGGITEENLLTAAQTGVDIISLGALTHSVKALDISMRIQV